MDWTFNGIVVTSAAPGRFTMPTDKYFGASYGDPWPLKSVKASPGSAEGEMIDLVQHMPLDKFVKRSDGLHSVPIVDDLSLHPWVMSDLDLALKFIEMCDKQGISTRRILCATTCPYPEMDGTLVDQLLSQSRFLGFDYVSWDFGWSALQGLAGPRQEGPVEYAWWIEEAGLTEAVNDAEMRFKQFSHLQNEFGLFNSETDVLAYATAYWEIAERTTAPPADEDSYTYLETAVELWPCKTWELR